MTINPSDITAIIVAVTGLAAAIGIAIVNIMAARAVSKKVDENTKMTQAVSAKADVIEGHVNSAATSAEKKNEALQQELRLMREVMADRKEVAALLAQSAASHLTEPTAPVATETVKDSSSTASLKKIDTNTAAIEKNTARTDATVQDLKDQK